MIAWQASTRRSWTHQPIPSLDLADSASQPGHTHVAADIDAEASTDGYVLTSDGAGNAAWEVVSGGGGGARRAQ